MTALIQNCVQTASNSHPRPLAVHPDPSKGDSSALSRFNRGSAAIEEGGEAYKGLRPATQYPAAPYRARRKLLFVGRHIERKGITYLIDAIKLLPSDYTLTIIGDGDQTDTLKKQAKELIKQGRVVFTGRLSAEEITRAYKDHDVFVCPSIVDSKGDTEGLGVVLIEAIAAELPIVASDVGGIPDLIIDAQTGLLVGQKESLALAAAIQKIGNDETLAQKLIEGARAHAQKHFSWESVTQQTIALYGRFLIK